MVKTFFFFFLQNKYSYSRSFDGNRLHVMLYVFFVVLIHAFSLCCVCMELGENTLRVIGTILGNHHHLSGSPKLIFSSKLFWHCEICFFLIFYFFRSTFTFCMLETLVIFSSSNFLFNYTNSSAKYIHHIISFSLLWVCRFSSTLCKFER